MPAAGQPALALVAAWLCVALPPRAAAETRAEELGALAPFSGRSVAAIELVGHDSTRDDVIRREIETAVGAPLSLASVAADVQRLDNLQIFAQITVSAEPDGSGVRLTFRFKEMPAWLLWAGFSYTEQDGFSAGPKLSALNLSGRAVSLGARAYFGGAKQYSARLTWPWILPRHHTTLDFYGARLKRTDTLNDFKETSYEFTPELSRYLGKHGRLEAKFSLFRMHSDVDGKTLDPDNQDTLPRVGAAIGWDTRDSWRLPRRGWQNELELWYTGGDGDSWSMNLDLRRWIPVTDKQRLLVSSLTSLQSGTVGVDVPQYLLYRMGGANSIRGYSIDELGRTLFGKNQLIGTLEYSLNLVGVRRFDIWRFAVSMGLDLTVFADAGIAWSESHDLAMNKARGGLGAGLRLLVPGSEMVRFDVGWSPEGGFQFHFASGSKPVAQRQRIR
jgi:outer membrane protein assembly factor BamA